MKHNELLSIMFGNLLFLNVILKWYVVPQCMDMTLDYIVYNNMVLQIINYYVKILN